MLSVSLLARSYSLTYVEVAHLRRLYACLSVAKHVNSLICDFTKKTIQVQEYPGKTSFPYLFLGKLTLLSISGLNLCNNGNSVKSLTFKTPSGAPLFMDINFNQITLSIPFVFLLN